MIQPIISPLGIEAWLVEDYAVPLLAVDVAFRGGAAQDPASRPGLGEMMASLLDEGAGPLDDEAFQLRVEEEAVELYFSVTRDALTASVRTVADRKERAFELLRLALAEPRFDADPVERIRQGLLAGLRREATDPNMMASRSFYAGLFPDHPYGRWPRGTLESLGAITRDEVAEHHRRLVARDNLVVSIVGAIDAKQAAAMLDKVLGALPAKASLAPVPDVKPANFGERRPIDLDVPQTVLEFCDARGGRADPDYLAAYTVNHILGGGSFSSWLFQNVREKRGLAYSVSTVACDAEHTAFVGGGVSTRNDRAAESLSIIEARWRGWLRRVRARRSSSAPRNTSPAPTRCASTARPRSPTS